MPHRWRAIIDEQIRRCRALERLHSIRITMASQCQGLQGRRDKWHSYNTFADSRNIFKLSETAPNHEERITMQIQEPLISAQLFTNPSLESMSQAWTRFWTPCHPNLHNSKCSPAWKRQEQTFGLATDQGHQQSNQAVFQAFLDKKRIHNDKDDWLVNRASHSRPRLGTDFRSLK